MNCLYHQQVPQGNKKEFYLNISYHIKYEKGKKRKGKKKNIIFYETFVLQYYHIVPSAVKIYDSCREF
jgi:hypothetical protein